MPAADPSAPPITAAVQAAYARYSRQAGRWLTGYAERGGTVHCGAGCFRCCDMPIRVSLAEALTTAAGLSPAQLSGMERHARAVIRNAAQARTLEAYVEGHRLEVGFCPLLDRESGRCGAYEGRPTRCRDTFSALPASFCAAGALERLTRRERADYDRTVRQLKATDGHSHYIAPLENLSQPLWDACARLMQDAWGLQVWGDFWLLTTLTQDRAFMDAVSRGRGRDAVRRAQALRLDHPELLEIG